MKPVVLIAALGVVLGGFVSYNYVHKPHQQKLRRMEASIQEERARHALQEDVAALLTQVEQYRKRLASEPDVSVLYREVVALAEQAGVQVTTIAQEPPQPLQQYTRLGVNLQFSASYHQLGTFIDHLERSPLFIHVDRLEAGDPFSGDQVSVKLSLSTLYLPPPADGKSG